MKDLKKKELKELLYKYNENGRIKGIEDFIQSLLEAERKKTIEEVKVKLAKELSYESKYSEVAEIIDNLTTTKEGGRK